MEEEEGKKKKGTLPKEDKKRRSSLLTFPPGNISIELAARVSPGAGRRSTFSTTSWLIEPTTRRGGARVEVEGEEAGAACAFAAVVGAAGIVVVVCTRARAEPRSM